MQGSAGGRRYSYSYGGVPGIREYLFNTQGLDLKSTRRLHLAAEVIQLPSEDGAEDVSSDSICDLKRIYLCRVYIYLCRVYSWLCKRHLAAEVIQMPCEDGAEDVIRIYLCP